MNKRGLGLFLVLAIVLFVTGVYVGVTQKSFLSPDEYYAEFGSELDGFEEYSEESYEQDGLDEGDSGFLQKAYGWFARIVDPPEPEDPEEPEDPFEPLCEDSDGNDLTVAGYYSGKYCATGHQVSGNESCHSDIMVKEYTCVGDCLNVDEVYCEGEYSYCDNGACNTYPNGLCEDSDGGKIYDIKGEVYSYFDGPRGVLSSKQDECYDDGSNTLVEYYCEEIGSVRTPNFEIKKCPEGTICPTWLGAGSCVPEVKGEFNCIDGDAVEFYPKDSDESVEEWIEGTGQLFVGSHVDTPENEWFFDECTDSGKITEWYCAEEENGDIGSKSIELDCGEDYECVAQDGEDARCEFVEVESPGLFGCNNNGVCEEGEDSDSCPGDCDPEIEFPEDPLP